MGWRQDGHLNPCIFTDKTVYVVFCSFRVSKTSKIHHANWSTKQYLQDDPHFFGDYLPAMLQYKCGIQPVNMRTHHPQQKRGLTASSGGSPTKHGMQLAYDKAMLKFQKV